MSRLGKHTEKKTDNYSVGSKKKLKAAVEHKMKRIYVGILATLEKEKNDGNIDKDLFDSLRSRILNIGNDQIRNIRKELDDRYNVEFLTYNMLLKVKPLEGSPEAIIGREGMYEG